jgi:predicted Na+-dependent transporter
VAAVFDLAWIIAVVLVAIGIYALVRPDDLARRYGVPAEKREAGAYVRAAGVRDIALGVVLAATAYFHSLPLLVVFAVVGIVVSIADLGIVHQHGRPPHHAAHAIHGSGIIAFILVLSMALFAIGR